MFHFIKKRLSLEYEKGVCEGFREGFQEGFYEGRQKERTEIAKKMLNQNMDIQFISMITGLSKKQIESLK